MNVLIVSGIWPPDVGGPASHAPALARRLAAHGHEVAAVTTADRPPAPEPFPVDWVARSRPPGLRHLSAVAAVAKRAGAADVVYATSMIRRAWIGARARRTPFVVKLVADEAYERDRRSGRFRGTLEAYQQHGGDLHTRLLRASRTAALREAVRVICPSEYLRQIALTWGLPEGRVVTIRNPAPPVDGAPSRSEARAALGVGGQVLGFAGRLTAQKDLDLALEAVRATGATLLLLGDGPERPRLETRARELGLAERVRFLGAGSRLDVLTVFRAADVSLLSSSWENMPHTVLESLAVGTPVIATSVGGVPEVVRDGENGLLVPAGDHPAFVAAVQRALADPVLLTRLAAAAPASVVDLAEDRVLARIEDVLLEVTA